VPGQLKKQQPSKFQTELKNEKAMEIDFMLLDMAYLLVFLLLFI